MTLAAPALTAPISSHTFASENSQQQAESEQKTSQFSLSFNGVEAERELLRFHLQACACL